MTETATKTTARDRSYYKQYLVNYYRNIPYLLKAKYDIDAHVRKHSHLLVESSPRSYWEIQVMRRKLRQIRETYVRHNEWLKKFVREEDMICLALACRILQKQNSDRPLRILNVGLAKGMSVISLKTLIQDCVIDSIEIDPDAVDYYQTVIEPIFEDSRKNHALYLGSSIGLNPRYERLNERLKSRVGSLDEHTHLIKKLLKRERYDMIFLDGDHSFSHVREELEAIHAHVAASASEPCFIAMHDIGREPGQAAEDFANEHNVSLLKINLLPNAPRIGLMVL